MNTNQQSLQLLYVSDPSSIALNHLPDPVTESDLRRWMDTVAEAGIDTFCQEVFSQGWTAYFRSGSADYEYDQRRQHQRFLPLLEAGTVPLQVLADQCHQRGLRFTAGFRMNDGHAHQARAQGLSIARFIERHPELQLTDFPEGEYYKLSEPLDFSHAAVRDFTYRIIEEVVDRFAVDGIELCFRDHAYFPPNCGTERGQLMTELIQRLRQHLGGVPIGVRVFSTIEECVHLGLDVPTWVKDDLIDYVSPQDTMYNDFHLPLQQWAAVTDSVECALVPTLLPWTSLRSRGRLDQIPLSEANARALAHTSLAVGAEGLAIYNHFCTYWHAPFYPQHLFALRQLSDAARVAAGDRHYVFDPTWDRMTGFGREGATSTGTLKAPRLVLERGRRPSTGEYLFCLYEDLQAVAGATLLFRGFHLTEDDQLEVRINGHLVPEEDIRRTRASDVPPDWDHTMSVGDRRFKAIPEQGRIDFREEGEPPFSTRWFSLEESWLVQGQNRLALTLAVSAPGAEDSIEIDEVEVWVSPR